MRRGTRRSRSVGHALFATALLGCYTEPHDRSSTGVEPVCDPVGPTCDCAVEDIHLLEEPRFFELAASPRRCEPSSCRRTVDGSVVMNYCFQKLEPSTSPVVPEVNGPPFAGCTFARADLRKFDGHFDNDGVDLEVTFCVASPGVPGELNLWYGENPFRRLLRLIDKNRYAVAGCYVTHFAAHQAQTPAFAEIAPECHDQCGENGGSACRLDLVDENADPTQAPLTIVAENTDEAVVGQVWVKSVRFVSNHCRCRTDRDCADAKRPSCQPFAETPMCPAPETALGVCSASAE